MSKNKKLIPTSVRMCSHHIIHSQLRCCTMSTALQPPTKNLARKYKKKIRRLEYKLQQTQDYAFEVEIKRYTALLKALPPARSEDAPPQREPVTVSKSCMSFDDILEEDRRVHSESDRQKEVQLMGKLLTKALQEHKKIKIRRTIKQMRTRQTALKMWLTYLDTSDYFQDLLKQCARNECAPSIKAGLSDPFRIPEIQRQSQGILSETDMKTLQYIYNAFTCIIQGSVQSHLMKTQQRIQKRKKHQRRKIRRGKH